MPAAQHKSAEREKMSKVSVTTSLANLSSIHLQSIVLFTWAGMYKKTKTLSGVSAQRAVSLFSLFSWFSLFPAIIWQLECVAFYFSFFHPHVKGLMHKQIHTLSDLVVVFLLPQDVSDYILCVCACECVHVCASMHVASHIIIWRTGERVAQLCSHCPLSLYILLFPPYLPHYSAPM